MSLELGSVIKKQWEKVVEANNKYPEYETVRIPLTQLDIDSKTIYLFLKEFSTMLNDNPNLLTIIHNGKEVLRAYAEGTKDGVYDSIKPIEFDGWEKSTPLDDVEAVFNYVKPIAKAKTGIDVGVLKFAHVDFFKEFHPVFDEKNSNLESVCYMYDCTRKVVDKGLIKFYPEPKFLKFLTETKGVEWRPEEMKKSLEKWLRDQNYGVLIKAKDGLIGMVISKREDNLYIEFTRPEVDELKGEKLKDLTNEYRKKMGVGITIGLETDSLNNVVNKILKHSLKDKEVVDEIISYIKSDYGKGVYISSNPAVGTMGTVGIKITPAWIMKKIGYGIHKKIFQ